MTPSSTSDLVSRVLAAIDETERIARATTGGGNAGWHDQAWAELRTKAGADPHWWQVAVQGRGSDTMQPRPPVDSRPDFRHMAHNDPPSVLRRCAADRKLLDMIQRGAAGHPGRCVNYEGQEPADYMFYDSCERHVEWSKAAIVIPELRELILHNLAEGYGITPEEN